MVLLFHQKYSRDFGETPVMVIIASEGAPQDAIARVFSAIAFVFGLFTYDMIRAFLM